MTSSDNPLVLTMDGDKSLSANYSLNTYTLTVNATNGTVTKLPDQSAYDHDTVVQLTAVPATGYHFVNWTGDASGTELTTSVTMDGNKSVTANFAIDTFTLTYTAGTGGTISGLTPQTVNYGDDRDSGHSRSQHRLALRRLVGRRPDGCADGPRRHGQYHGHGQLRD